MVFFGLRIFGTAAAHRVVSGLIIWLDQDVFLHFRDASVPSCLHNGACNISSECSRYCFYPVFPATYLRQHDRQCVSANVFLWGPY